MTAIVIQLYRHYKFILLGPIDIVTITKMIVLIDTNMVTYANLANQSFRQLQF